MTVQPAGCRLQWPLAARWSPAAIAMCRRRCRCCRWHRHPLSRCHHPLPWAPRPRCCTLHCRAASQLACRPELSRTQARRGVASGWAPAAASRPPAGLGQPQAARRHPSAASAGPQSRRAGHLGRPPAPAALAAGPSCAPCPGPRWRLQRRGRRQGHMHRWTLKPAAGGAGRRHLRGGCHAFKRSLLACTETTHS